MISDLSRSRDEKIRKATVCYQNSTKAVDQFTNPAAQQLKLVCMVFVWYTICFMAAAIAFFLD